MDPAQGGQQTIMAHNTDGREGAVAMFEAAKAAYMGGDAAQAQTNCLQVLQKDSAHDEAHFMLALIALAGGALQEAETHVRAALTLREHPAYAATLANLLRHTQRVAEAQTWYRRASARAPEDLGILCELANLLKDEGELEEAETFYQRILQLDPEGLPALNNLGLLRMAQGRPGEARDFFLRALASSPDSPDAQNNLGNAQRTLRQLGEAETSYRRALALRPEFALARASLGLLLQEVGRHEEALRELELALAMQADNASTRRDVSISRLALADYPRGLRDFEARFDPSSGQSPVKLPPLDFPQWQGEDLQGKSLLVWPEQGFGDYIQFARYFPMLKARGLVRLTVCCHPALAPLLQTAQGVDAVVSDDAMVTPHDYWVFPMSLALHFDTRIDTIPAHLPYLHALPERLRSWLAPLETGKRKVGLVWKGSAGHVNDTNRSLPSLDVLAPLWNLPGLQFFSLQKGQGEAEAEAAAAAGTLVHLGARIADLADTAAIIAQLDLVICIDTAIAHLAGALGKPCWVLLPAIGCDWRWHLERSDTPWYPNVMKLFRQRVPGDWGEVVARLRTSLEQQ